MPCAGILAKLQCLWVGSRQGAPATGLAHARKERVDCLFARSPRAEIVLVHPPPVLSTGKPVTVSSGVEPVE